MTEEEAKTKVCHVTLDASGVRHKVPGGFVFQPTDPGNCITSAEDSSRIMSSPAPEGLWTLYVGIAGILVGLAIGRILVGRLP